MRKIKRTEDSLIISRRLVMPDQTNPNGSLFGGVLLSWIDKAAFMTGQRHSGRAHVVTVHMERVDFLFPLKVGDHALIESRIQSVGSSSMNILVEVKREDAFSGETLAVGSARLTFVALDEQGKPTLVPELLCETISALEPAQDFQRPKLRQNNLLPS